MDRLTLSIISISKYACVVFICRLLRRYALIVLNTISLFVSIAQVYDAWRVAVAVHFSLALKVSTHTHSLLTGSKIASVLILFVGQNTTPTCFLISLWCYSFTTLVHLSTHLAYILAAHALRCCLLGYTFLNLALAMRRNWLISFIVIYCVCLSTIELYGVHHHILDDKGGIPP